jgi:hypothetical protein
MFGKGYLLENHKKSDTYQSDTYMANHRSRIICPKCRKKGGTLTTRLTGHSKKSLSAYIQHYDPLTKTGKSPCYISRNGIAHINLTDKRYESEYKPLVKYWRIAAGNHLLNEEQSDKLLDQAVRLLRDMGWPDHSLDAHDKFFADLYEILVEEFALQYQQKSIKITHDDIAKKHFKKQLNDALSLTEKRKKNNKKQRRRITS